MSHEQLIAFRTTPTTQPCTYCGEVGHWACAGHLGYYAPPAGHAIREDGTMDCPLARRDNANESEVYLVLESSGTGDGNRVYARDTQESAEHTARIVRGLVIGPVLVVADLRDSGYIGDETP